MLYHSEHGQDRWLNENIFKGRRNGVFVEFGALDGIYTSNSLFFERELGWTGVLIEADPSGPSRPPLGVRCPRAIFSQPARALGQEASRRG
jgi:hypothetical protein